MLSLNTETSSADEFGVHLKPELHVRSVPRGRSAGLFGALAGAICNIDTVRTLPVTNLEDLGRPARMFDYDPAQAVDLDIALG